VLVEAVSLITPCSPTGSPSNCRSQSSVTSSSSVAAGPLRQSMAFTLSAAISDSARIPGPEPVIPK
jgi:hypothetical protein